MIWSICDSSALKIGCTNQPVFQQKSTVMKRRADAADTPSITIKPLQRSYTTTPQCCHWIVEKMQMHEDEGKSTLGHKKKNKKIGDYTTTWNWRPEGWKRGSFILRSFFQAFYFCVWQTRKQNILTILTFAARPEHGGSLGLLPSAAVC